MYECMNVLWAYTVHIPADRIDKVPRYVRDQQKSTHHNTLIGNDLGKKKRGITVYCGMTSGAIYLGT